MKKQQRKNHIGCSRLSGKKGAWCDMLTEKTRKETWRQTWGLLEGRYPEGQDRATLNAPM